MFMGAPLSRLAGAMQNVESRETQQLQQSYARVRSRVRTLEAVRHPSTELNSPRP
jgi:hypothetical protein